MNFLGGSSTSRPNQAPPVPDTALRVQTAVNGQPIPILHGQRRLAGNLLWYDNFVATAVPSSSSSSSGGKNIFGGGGSCFAGGTLLSTPYGLKRIDACAIGDKVYSFDPKTGEKVGGIVTKVSKHDMAENRQDKMLRIRAGHVALHLTSNHYLWLDGVTKRDAEDLKPGDALQDEAGRKVIIKSVEPGRDVDFTWNLTVEPHHNFYANGILSHNGSSGGSGKSTGSYTYTADIIWGLCEGPIDAVLIVWNGKTPTYLSNLDLTTFDGSQGQPAWAWLESENPEQALGYSSLVYAGANPFQLGGSSSTPNLNWECRGAIAGALSEITTIGSGLTFTPLYFTLASSTTEAVVVPPVSPYTVQAASYEALNAVPVVLTDIASGSLPDTNSSGVIYTLTGTPLQYVSGTPTTGQFTFNSAGLYTFSAGDAGALVTIIDLAVGPAVNYAYQPTGNITINSQNITGISNMANIAVGQIVVHALLPGGTVVQSISGSTIAVSQPATGNAIVNNQCHYDSPGTIIPIVNILRRRSAPCPISVNPV